MATVCPYYTSWGICYNSSTIYGSGLCGLRARLGKWRWCMTSDRKTGLKSERRLVSHIMVAPKKGCLGIGLGFSLILVGVTLSVLASSGFLRGPRRCVSAPASSLDKPPEVDSAIKRLCRYYRVGSATVMTVYRRTHNPPDESPRVRGVNPGKGLF